MTLLVTSIPLERFDELLALADKAWAGGSDAVELRIDAYGDDPGMLAAYLQEHLERTWIVTCRSADEGGSFSGDEAQRVSLLIAVTRETNAFVDFEFADWKRSANIRQKVLLAAAGVDGADSRLILSAHDFDGSSRGCQQSIEEMNSVSACQVSKVAYRADHIDETFEALDAMHIHHQAVTAIAMGEEGLWTRVLARKLGAFASYCSLTDEDATAPGQLSLDDMVGRFRWRSITASTQVYGVIGDPVAHSMSPLLFNYWFDEYEIDAVYLPLRVRGGEDGLKSFLKACGERPWLDLAGLSVTIPHKLAALSLAGDGADWMARRVGAANTLSFRDGAVKAFNTDCYAAVSSIAAALGRSRTGLAGLSVNVLGVGGASRALAYGLPMFGCSVTLFGRSEEKTRALADEFGVTTASWDDRLGSAGDVLINCTSVGMWPGVDESPMPAESLAGYELVFDVVYNPLQSKLLVEAAAMGCRVLSGLDMFVRQAATQFELWTGRTVEIEAASEMLTGAIRVNESKSE